MIRSIIWLETAFVCGLWARILLCWDLAIDGHLQCFFVGLTLFYLRFNTYFPPFFRCIYCIIGIYNNWHTYQLTINTYLPINVLHSADSEHTKIDQCCILHTTHPYNMYSFWLSSSWRLSSVARWLLLLRKTLNFLLPLDHIVSIVYIYC